VTRHLALQLSGFDEDVAKKPEHGEENHSAVSSAFRGEPLRDVTLETVSELAAMTRDDPGDVALCFAPVRIGDVNDPQKKVAAGAGAATGWCKSRQERIIQCGERHESSPEGRR
jgi:hypothetical protein